MHIMAKRIWLIWLVPFTAWGLYWCWSSGYNAGYEEGHQEAWSRATGEQQAALAKPPGLRFAQPGTIR